MRPVLVRGADPTQLFGAVVNLLGASETHHGWSVVDLHRLVLPPIGLGQCLAFSDGRGRLFGWFSWANLTSEAEAGLLTGARKLVADDWNAGDGSRIWIIDGLAPWGGLQAMARVIRRELSETAQHESWPATSAAWQRRDAGGAVRRQGFAMGEFDGG